MATDTQITTEPRIRLYRLDVDQLFRMIDAGVFARDNRAELLGGLLVRKMTKYPPHNFTIGRTGNLLRALLPADWAVREEKAALLNRFWRPEPDLAVVRGPDDRYRKADPAPADIALLIEVADSTYRMDRGAKWRQYAACGVAVYWIINLAGRSIEVYSQPSGKGKSAGYGESQVYSIEDALPVWIEGQAIGTLAVKDLLP